MNGYPADKSALPVATISDSKHYEAKYSHGLDTVNGHIVYRDSQGYPRKYLFESKFRNAEPDTQVSLANPDSWSSFSTHKTDERELKGAPKGHMKDQIAFSSRVAKECRRRYLECQDFLNFRIENGARIIASENKGPFKLALYRDGDWVLTKNVGPRITHFSARHLQDNASDTDFAREVAAFRADTEEYRRLETEVSERLKRMSEDDEEVAV